MNIKGVDGTVGAVSAWSGNREVGVGEEEIKKISQNERIDFELRFDLTNNTEPYHYEKCDLCIMIDDKKILFDGQELIDAILKIIK